MELVKLGDPLPLSLALEDGATDQYIQATLMQRSGSVIATYSVPHVSDGVYSRADVPSSSVGDFILKIDVYRDSGFTVPSKKYSKLLKTVRIENIESSLTETIDLSDGRAV